MKNRKQRVELIIELIRSRSIGSQEELAGLLAESGYKVTQATLSRDLKLLKTTKVPTEYGTYIYVLPDFNAENAMTPASSLALNSGNHINILSLEFSGNLAVIKTRCGYAPGLAHDLDLSNIPEILGTVPGSDTVIAVLREDVSHSRAREILSKALSLNY